MQKKILLSLLMASPTAIPALANINLGTGEWSSQGTSSSGDVTIDNESGSVSNVLAGGETRWNVGTLQPGTYELTFATTNNLFVQILLDGTELTKANMDEESSVEFSLEKAGTVTIVTKGITAAAYGFTGSQLSLAFDFEAAGLALQEQLDGLTPFVEITDTTFPGAKELLNEKEAIENAKTPLQAIINQLKNPATPAEDLMKIYNEQDLWIASEDKQDKLTTAIAGINTQIEAWNEKAEALNTAIKNTADNKAAKAALLEEQEDLLDQIEKLIEDIEGGSAYSKNKNLAGAKALQTEIEAYADAINAAYADDKLAGEIEFESQATDLKAKIDEIQEAWDADEADWNAYQTFMNTVFPDLQNAFDQGTKAVEGLEGVEGKVDNFKKQKDKALSDITEIYNAAKAALNITSAEGAAALLEGDQETVANAKADIEKIVNDLKVLVNVQNTNYTTAADQINDFTEELDEIKEQCKVVPGSIEKQYNNAVSDIESKLADLQSYVDDKYAAAELDTTDTEYTAQVEALQNALEELNTLVEPIKAINELASNLEKVKKDVKEASNELGTTYINLYELFNLPGGTFEAIDNAINNLEPNDVEGQKDDIQAAIDDAKATADKLVDVFTKLQVAADVYQQDADDLAAFVNDKIEIGKDGKPATALKDAFLSATGEGGKFLAAQQKFNTDLTTVGHQENPQTIYNDAVKLFNDNIEGEGEDVTYKWQEGLETIEVEFAKTVTDSNKANLDTLIQNVKDDAAEGTYAGQDTIDFTDIDTAAGKIATAIANAATAEKPIEAYGDADQAILDLIPDLDTIKAKVVAYKQNQADYDAFIATLDGSVQEDIDALIAQNNKESRDNGLAYFANLINGEDNEDSIQATLDALKKALSDALQEYADPDKNVTGLKTNFEAQINALQELIKKTANDITANNTAHTQQLNTAEEVAEAIVAALTQLEEYYEGQKNQAGIEEWYDDTKAELEGLRDNDLFNNNVAVAADYGKGQSSTNDSELTGEYNRIKAAVETIVDSMRDTFTKAVVDANQAVVDNTELENLENSNWDGLKAAMNAEYVSAISTFNEYYFGLKNTGWKETVFGIEGFEARHEAIYDYSLQINELIAEVNKYIAEKNAVPTTFTEAEFTTVALDKAYALIKGMQQKVDELNATVAAAAEAYYADLKASAETQITGYEDALTAAGFSSEEIEDALKSVKGALDQAAEKYKEATKESATQPLGLAMDEIANDLDKANAKVDLQALAVNAWDTLYGDALEDAQNLLTDLGTPAEDYKFATDTVRQDAIEAINDLISEMKGLNTEVSGITDGFINDYADYKAQLEALVAQIESEAKTVKDNSTNNLESKNLYETLTGTTIPDLDASYKALLEYADSMAGGQDFDAASIKAAIDALSEYVEKNSGALATNKNYVNTTVDGIKNSIKTGYSQIAYNEYDVLAALIGEVKVSFNDAKAAFHGAEGTTSLLDSETGDAELNGWNNDIDGYAAQIAALKLLPGAPNFNQSTFQTQAIALEKALTDLMATLEQSWTSSAHDGANPADAVITQLQDKYEEVDTAIKGAEEYLNNCEEGLDTSEYKTALDAATTQLDAVKATWEAAGNRVLTMADTYSDEMETIKGNVEDILAAMTAANEQAKAEAAAKAANQAAYERLTGELDDLKAELERVVEIVNEWYPNLYNWEINSIKWNIQDAENELEDKYENTQLTASSTLPYGTTIKNNIASLELQVTQHRAQDTRRAASSALVEASSFLNANAGRIVPEELESLQEKLSTLETAYRTAYNQEVDVMKVTVAVLNNCITEYERIKTEAEDLKATISENTYVLGDVNLNPDGRVTAVDVQMILSWVLEGMTWEELKAENPRQAYAADLNGDKQLNITDVTMDIALVFGNENPRVAGLQRMAAARAQESNASMGLMLVGEENGIRRYAVTLDNSMAIIAGQLDIKLPSGMRIAGISTAERNLNHEVQSYDQSSRLTRVAIYSMENAAFEANSGAVLYIDVEGNGDFKVDNMILTDINYNTIVLESGSHSIVDSIMEGAREMGTKIYNTAGMMLNRIQKGINIFRTSDGKVKKEYNKK